MILFLKTLNNEVKGKQKCIFLYPGSLGEKKTIFARKKYLIKKGLIKLFQKYFHPVAIIEK